MGGTPTARELVDQLDRLFDSVDFLEVRDSLEGRLGPAESDAVLGEFSRFVREAVDANVVVDFRGSEGGAIDSQRQYRGLRGWVEAWRVWFEPWDFQETTLREVDELDAECVVEHLKVLNRGRGSGVEVEWEAWNVWLARDGKVVRLEQYEAEDEARAAVNRLGH